MCSVFRKFAKQFHSERCVTCFYSEGGVNIFQVVFKALHLFYINSSVMVSTKTALIRELVYNLILKDMHTNHTAQLCKIL
jgi:hypothetical protein